MSNYLEEKLSYRKKFRNTVIELLSSQLIPLELIKHLILSYTYSLDGIMFRFGGVENHDSTNKCYMMDVYSCNLSQWVSLPPLSTARRLCSAALLNDYIYVTSGHSGKSYLSSVERLSIETGNWTTVASMNIKRQCCITVTLNNRLIVIGGSYGLKWFSSMEIYDDKKNQWSLMDKKCDMKEARAYHSGIVVDDRYIFVFGGCDTKSCERFDSHSNTWSSIADMKHGRDSAAAVLLGNDMIAVMGGEYEWNYYDTVELYNIRTNKWHDADFKLPLPLAYFSAHVIDGYGLVIAGGQTMGHVSQEKTYRFDIVRKEWSELPALPEKCSRAAYF